GTDFAAFPAARSSPRDNTDRDVPRSLWRVLAARADAYRWVPGPSKHEQADAVQAAWLIRQQGNQSVTATHSSQTDASGVVTRGGFSAPAQNIAALAWQCLCGLPRVKP